MATVIDRKYQIMAINPCSGKVHNEHDSILFMAADRLVPSMLAHYILEAEKDPDIGEDHVESMILLLQRVQNYQSEHGMKIPDTDTPCEVDRCIGGKI